jgi:hypothetical protein
MDMLSSSPISINSKDDTVSSDMRFQWKSNISTNEEILDNTNLVPDDSKPHLSDGTFTGTNGVIH